ncbi:Uncharacterized protein APZ42_025962 [Daphnia magna]|uniref:Uncharacterized protein n=1 Tax=Daphnia magna TaxID=35525 RepID=A0A164SLI4_9CRUS|nr:Uncharacterized protein APZ42_025962 [Daphnia magna]
MKNHQMTESFSWKTSPQPSMDASTNTSAPSIDHLQPRRASRVHPPDAGKASGAIILGFTQTTPEPFSNKKMESPSTTKTQLQKIGERRSGKKIPTTSGGHGCERKSRSRKRRQCSHDIIDRRITKPAPSNEPMEAGPGCRNGKPHQAGKTEKHWYEREKESDWRKFRSAIDERLAQHNEATSTNAAHNTESHGQHQGARPKKPTVSAGNQDSGPPPYREDYVSTDAESVQSHQPPHKDKDSNANNCRLTATRRIGKIFFAIFRDLVHNNFNLTTTQKMAILKRCLTSEIRDGLSDSLSSPALYQEALKELESTYGHPRSCRGLIFNPSFSSSE